MTTGAALAGTVVVLVGGGLGEHRVARHLADSGARLVVVSTEHPDENDVAVADTSSVTWWPASGTSQRPLESTIQEILAHYGRIDMVLNCDSGLDDSSSSGQEWECGAVPTPSW
jgi:NAD(P)-dependent dehydrogenase (short-subunit alcohol dehydrogenase family)